MALVTSWGRLGAFPHTVASLTSTDLLPDSCGQLVLPFGNGRSYGDVCLNPHGALWLASSLDRFIAFDEQTGVLECEAGVLLRSIQNLVVPKGWMLPVTPGTQLITVGGAIANDVHGKNHHVYGTFGDNVISLRLLRTTGEAVECAPTHNGDWFAATVGGMGLTGVVTQARLQLRRVPSPWLETETLPYRHLDEFFKLADESEKSHEYTVSWIDCLSRHGGRGVFMRANHVWAEDGPLRKSEKKSVPFVPPVSMVNRFTVRPFNLAYFYIQALKRRRMLQHYEPFFYPLDNLLDWNRIYGVKGFFQYQCVVPRSEGLNTIAAMLEEISRSGMGSFLAVLKTFGHRTPVGLMSFPQPGGVTLALDFPNQGEKTYHLFANLDGIVREVGGRLYAAKDARMLRDMFEAGYPSLETFTPYRDPGISSSMSRRLMGY